MDGKEFDFFFALKLIKVPMMEIDDFLDYQLTQSFGGDHEKFKRYLKLLPRYISSELLQLEHEGNRLEFSADLDLSI